VREEFTRPTKIYGYVIALEKRRKVKSTNRPFRVIRSMRMMMILQRDEKMS
jgi:hypothetical protein